MEIQTRTSSAPNWNAQASFGNQKKLANIPFQANQPEIAKKDNEQSKLDGSASAKKESRWSSRKVIDAFTVTFYAALVASAIAIRKGRPKFDKLVDGLDASKKETKTARDEIMTHGKQLTGELGKGGPMYKFFNYCRKLKENSCELTNNLVYGFGTLVVMPLVILFSPIGKKDASKEDRTFTVLRQPISFATVFTVQLTFEKVFKSLTKDLNRFRLLDGTKGKDGKELFFSDGRISDVLQDTLKDHGKNGNYSFNEKCLAQKDKFKHEINILKEHIEGVEGEFERGDKRFYYAEKGKGNNFTLEQFSKSIVSLINNIGESLKAPKKGTNEKGETLKNIDNLKEMLKPYSDKIPGFEDKLVNMAKAPARNRALKETSVVIANCFISQALGIMMLNFLYGKMIKKYTSMKQGASSPDKQDSVKGGVNNGN